MKKIAKGQHAPLNVTQKANHRVLVGLGWDPNEKASLIDKVGEMMGGKKTYHDLDLLCLIFDADQNQIGIVSSDPDMLVDDTGLIYHSGDNLEGFGGDDDEQISVELKELDRRIDAILFMVKIKSGHSFGEVLSPEIRLADGYSNHDFLHATLNDEDGKDKSAFVFAAIYRSDDNGWKFHNISEFLSGQDLKNNADGFTNYLSKQ